MRALGHPRGGVQRVGDMLEPGVHAALRRARATGRVVARRLRRRGEHRLVDPVAHDVDRRVGAQFGDRLRDPRGLGDERDRQVERQPGGDPVGLVLVVEAVLERLHEVRVALGPQREQRVRRRPPRGDREVEFALAPGRRGRRPSRCSAARSSTRASSCSRDRTSVTSTSSRAASRTRMLEHDADPARQLEVVDEERDVHDAACYGGACRLRRPANVLRRVLAGPPGGRP